jgi:hypothetical protein
MVGNDLPFSRPPPAQHWRRAILRFTDQQMKVLGHDDISHDDKLIPLPNMLQNHEKKVAPLRLSGKWGTQIVEDVGEVGDPADAE